MKKTLNLKKKFAALTLAVMMAVGVLPMMTPVKTYAAAVDASGAKTIALKEAGYNSESVKSLSSKLDNDGDEYIVKFKKGSYTYRYEVRKKSGVISESSRKLTKIKKTAKGKQISKSKATKIAYKKLGIKSARSLEREKETYQGAKVWDVSFKKGKYEYEFKIDRRSGKILYMEKGLD